MSLRTSWFLKTSYLGILLLYIISVTKLKESRLYISFMFLTSSDNIKVAIALCRSWYSPLSFMQNLTFTFYTCFRTYLIFLQCLLHFFCFAVIYCYFSKNTIYSLHIAHFLNNQMSSARGLLQISYVPVKFVLNFNIFLFF